MLQENDTSFISDEQVLRYVGQLAVYNGSHRPNAAFEYSGKKLKGFLLRVLKFNPLVRPTAAELLADPVFDKVRDPRLEELSSPSKKVNLPFDEDRELPAKLFECNDAMKEKDPTLLKKFKRMIISEAIQMVKK